MSDRNRHRPGERPGAIWACVVSAGCFLRGLPLFFQATPKTPLRVLGIIALDTLHVLRYSRPLPRQRVVELAMFLDLEGCANAAWDRKDLCVAEYQAIRQRLDRAGLGFCIEVYLDRLRELETRRPSIGGDYRRFDEVRAYREAVAWLSLSTASAIALNAGCSEDHLRAAHLDCDVDTLFRILMQFQIIDDVLDYTEDMSAGLPSFLTALASLPRSVALTAEAAQHYAAADEGAEHSVLPLRLTLWVVTVVTRLVVGVADRRHRHAHQFAH